VEFLDNKVIALIYYVTNTFLELLRLGKALDRVVRHMAKNLPLKRIRPLVERILYNV
jgi:hypothetical protein